MEFYFSLNFRVSEWLLTFFIPSFSTYVMFPVVFLFFLEQTWKNDECGIPYLRKVKNANAIWCANAMRIASNFLVRMRIPIRTTSPARRRDSKHRAMVSVWAKRRDGQMKYTSRTNWRWDCDTITQIGSLKGGESRQQLTRPSTV
jgi:hypothetical protein